MLKIRYLSHSAFILDDGTHQVIIDPFITGNPTCPINWEEVTAKFIVLTHAHGDHFGDTFKIAEKNGALVIAVNELANYVARNGYNAHNMHIGGSYNFPFGRLKFTMAHHGSAVGENEYMGEPAGVIITMGGKTIYHTGDTGLFMDMKLIGEINKIDTLMLPIGDNFTMGIDDAVRASEFVRPKIAIPMHYNTFPVIQANPHEFVQKASAKGIPARVLEYGESIEL